MANEKVDYVIDDTVPFDLSKDWAWNKKRLRAYMLRGGQPAEEVDVFLDKLEAKYGGEKTPQKP
ncbi:MAG: hypothetical protein MdMp014T_3007 [Treponematales bacterium]